MPPQSQSRADLADTRWSLVLRQSNSSTQAQNALSELARRYGYPVYSYFRCCGHAADIAREMTHAFLQHVIGEFRQPKDAARGVAYYREYLLERLHELRADNWRETTANSDIADLPEVPDVEERYLRDYPQSDSPDHAFQRSFALEVLCRALIRLREEAGQTGRQDMFKALEPFLAHDPAADVQAQLSGSLHIQPLALIMALKRLRQRLRELTGEELADTVSDSADLLAEQATLLGFLREENR